MKTRVTSCENKGTKCVAKDRDGNRWVYQAQSESEAELIVEAVESRGYVNEWWSKQ
jgi:hypothetical protein